MAALTKVSTFRQPVLDGDRGALRAFKEHVLATISDLEDHFAEEEKFYPRVIRESGMTQEQETAIVQKIIRSNGLAGNKVTLPSIVYAMHSWGGEAEVDALMGRVPPPIRWLLNNSWIYDFRDNNLAVAEALKGNVPYEPVKSSCDCCMM